MGPVNRPRRSKARFHAKCAGAAYALSDDASVIVGSSGWEPPTDAFIWTPDTGMKKASDWVELVLILRA